MQPKGNPSRVHVERGIYVRQTRDGRRYEAIYQDSTGETRWMTHATLKDARAARAEKVAALARGERIAPSKVKLADYADSWLASQTHLRPRTLKVYETNLRVHVLPRFGRLKLAEIDEDGIVKMIVELRGQGLAPWTIRGVLTVLGRLLGTATRRGLIPSNPIRKLERGERPSVERREMRCLDSNEIEKLLDVAAPSYRTLLAVAIFTGLRQGELLGLTWADIDLDARLVHVRKQLDRTGERVEPKTPSAKRAVVVMPSLAKMLRQHKEQAFARGHAKPTDYVFASQVGTPLYWRNVSKRALEAAVKRAGLDEEGMPRLRFHDLRHTAASILIAQGENVVYVSRQLGHASVKQTLDTYAHLIDRAEHAERASGRQEAAYGEILGS